MTDIIIILENLANVNRFLQGGENLYQKYAELRDKAKVTDYEVAKQTGVSTATLTNWKYGRYTPKVEKRMALARYFGVPIDVFVEDIQNENNEKEVHI
ncbi:DNA-binding transcriptional regulator, XRE-family HTH domain [Lacrimispora sphenoides]|nr:DNA-binding transcriptional regulator, XRE-family HTH domain [Lacrimispora sphenoides]